MREYLPIVIVGAIIGVFTLIFVLAYARLRRQKEAIGFDRNMPDGEIVRRLLHYAKPYRGQFVLVLVIMLVTIAYDVASPLIVGYIEELVKADFPLKSLFSAVAVYAVLLVISMGCTYFQSMILQKTGQKILAALRQDIFVHI